MILLMSGDADKRQAQMIMSSLVSGGQFWLSGRASFFICRLLIGLLQGGL
jgi:hypothetical protein